MAKIRKFSYSIENEGYLTKYLFCKPKSLRMRFFEIYVQLQTRREIRDSQRDIENPKTI